PWVERGRDIDHDRFVAEGRNPADSAGLGCEVDGPPEAGHRGQFERHADAAYIAACDPQTILALLDELETLRTALPAEPWVASDDGERWCYACDHEDTSAGPAGPVHEPDCAWVRSMEVTK